MLRAKHAYRARSALTAFERVENVIRQRRVEILGDLHLACQSAEAPLWPRFTERHQPGDRLTSFGNDDFLALGGIIRKMGFRCVDMNGSHWRPQS
jgi:hypothetical protein